MFFRAQKEEVEGGSILTLWLLCDEYGFINIKEKNMAKEEPSRIEKGKNVRNHNVFCFSDGLCIEEEGNFFCKKRDIFYGLN